MNRTPFIAVVVPCYGERDRILPVLAATGTEVSRIYVVDDGCPEHTGDWVEAQCRDPRVIVLRHASNQGVGGAMVTGYRHALAEGAQIVVKIDGDGQMDPALIGRFIGPLLRHEADYTKGNRFYLLESLQGMPRSRVVGNAVLTFLTKLSSGYWNLFDPTNGYTAIHARILSALPLDKLDRGFFFESDMLFRLNILRARVLDIPMRAVYRGEPSALHIRRIVLPFLRAHLRNSVKRLLYNYFLRDFSIASVEFVVGLGLLAFGTAFGAVQWVHHARIGQFASSGTVLLAVMPILVGIQLLLSFLAYDIASVPARAVHEFIDPPTPP